MRLKNERIRGGSFLLSSVSLDHLFIPEDLTDEHRMIGRMTSDFIEGEVVPNDQEIERQHFEVTVELLRQAGELGLLGADVPERYGGAGLDKISSAVITESMVRGSSFALTLGAHVGIGTLPIVLFGTEDQKQKYLPYLATGKKFAAYCLTEPSSGSDALGAKTVAELNEAGTHYILNGSKQYITNAGFADVFIVYAKVKGEKFTAFIVEREFPGLDTGPEEKKMGIKGSSTRPLILENCMVPVENVLGEVGNGHVIAFNILNIGRYKLAIGCVGTSKWVIELSAKYAKERKQFGKSIADFPLIQKKLAEMAVLTFATESMVYRTAGLMEEALASINQSNQDFGKQIAEAIEEYALECSINKVFASEALDFISDEGVQIHGGYGYIQDYKIERIYRDSRVNRIFEGTNEINRLLIPATLIKRAMKGKLPLMAAVQGLQKELVAYMPSLLEYDGPLAKEEAMVDAAKKIFLLISGTALVKHQQGLEDEQELLESIANTIITIFAMESCLLRTKKCLERNDPTRLKEEMTQVFIYDAFHQLEQTARTALASLEEGDRLQTQLSILKKLTRFTPCNTVQLKRSIARKILETEKYLA
ncbi:acyl-CoA dehydrogenase family protein [Ammoniphilus resinae]|uniref:Alkylation response protein AidB-like acyl-CoA dehydrogenase n=1 Tax=Ammoniphilus resinae TaxID=861532 RepID=A0ABS4GK30_9BACL|nr:acyl-CoA dehydrogenase family protein [Ammoniphilus resinae]MBP1930606.1 alkylation response protein AidB-like acyl-CoA dehydrogenase [Ammoniphilus resinae]